MPSTLGATGPRPAAPPSPTEWPALSAPKAGAGHYLEVGLGSGSLAAGASTGEIQLRPSKTDGVNVDEADDYSRATNTVFADAPQPPPTWARPPPGERSRERTRFGRGGPVPRPVTPPLAATAAALLLTAAPMLTGASHGGIHVDGDLVRGTEP